MPTQGRRPPLPKYVVDFYTGADTNAVNHQFPAGTERVIEPDRPISDARDRFEGKHANRWTSARRMPIIHGVYCDCPAYDDLGDDFGHPRGLGTDRDF